MAFFICGVVLVDLSRYNLIADDLNNQIPQRILIVQRHSDTCVSGAVVGTSSDAAAVLKISGKRRLISDFPSSESSAM